MIYRPQFLLQQVHPPRQQPPGRRAWALAIPGLSWRHSSCPCSSSTALIRQARLVKKREIRRKMRRVEYSGPSGCPSLLVCSSWVAALLSIKDYARIESIAQGATPLQALPMIIQDALGTFWGNVYLFVVLIAVFVCTLAIQSATIRLMFSMGRDRRLPFGNIWGSVNSTFHTPGWAGLAVGILAAIPFLFSQAIAVIVTGATGLIYLSYFMNNAASLNARLKGWPRDVAPFKLGRWGIVINIVALIYGGLMIINFLWFGGLRNVYTNPTIGTAFPGLNNCSGHRQHPHLRVLAHRSFRDWCHLLVWLQTPPRHCKW